MVVDGREDRGGRNDRRNEEALPRRPRSHRLHAARSSCPASSAPTITSTPPWPAAWQFPASRPPTLWKSSNAFGGRWIGPCPTRTLLSRPKCPLIECIRNGTTTVIDHHASPGDARRLARSDRERPSARPGSAPRCAMRSRTATCRAAGSRRTSASSRRSARAMGRSRP